MTIKLLTKTDIKDIFTNTVYLRGQRYYQEGRVKNLYHDPVRNIWTATVRGTRSYVVTVEDDGPGISTECNCPAYAQYWEPCKHIAAVMLEIYEQEHTGYSPSFHHDFKQKQAEILKQRQREAARQEQQRQAAHLKQLTNQFIQAIANYSQKGLEEERPKSLLMVEWIFHIQRPYFSKHHFLTIEMKVGEKRTYVVKKIADFLKVIENKTQYPFTKSFTFDPTSQMFLKKDQEIIDLLLKAEKVKESFRQFQPSYYQSTGMDDRFLSISPVIIDDLLEKLNNQQIHFENGKKAFEQITVAHHHLPFSIQLDKGKTDGFQLDLSEIMAFQYLDSYGYMLQDNTFYKISPEQNSLMGELKKLMDQTNRPLLPIANDQIEPFLSQVAPVIGTIGNLEMTEKVASQIIKYPLQAKVYVDLADGQLNVSLEFHYGEYMIDPFKQVSQEKGSPIIMRDADKEQSIMDAIESASLRLNGKGLYVDNEEGIFEFLYETLPKLEEKAEIFLTNPVRSLILPERQNPVTKIEVNSSGNLLEIGFDMDGIEQDEMQNILQSVIEKKKYYRLPNGAFVSLATSEFQTIQNMVQEFHIKPQQLQQESIKLPIYRGMQLDEMMNGGKAKYGKQFRHLLNRLKNPEELDFEIPKTLQAELRDYQYYGFQWLKTLEHYRLGGILADDMGLGKTLQSIAYILSHFSENNEAKPALIVAPASLIFNWKNEFQKFAPSLTAEVITGSPQERLDKLQSDQIPNVWITSYPTLRQDIDYYSELQFSTLILDEAQVIKNYATKTAKAVRGIHAELCFALSGTPIENSVEELWSIFQAVIPDFFPQQKAFRQLEPEKIARMIRPFLLRRLKKDVLKELPDKIETVNYSELTKPQKELYLAYLGKIQMETKESLQRDGFQKSQIKILAGLTRLRQLCCDPSLFLENYNGGSGKLEQLMETARNAVENGRRLLIFSQFTSMLSIIRKQLTKAGYRFFYLDGQTAPKERIKMVEQFNQGTGEVFLISLKAGNTGLNLTGADTVILYDLWWNPAVEEQAAGRAHRIGQKKVVQVIRMITQGTIEEKIYELQQSKNELINTVIQPGEKTISKLSEQEIREILNI